MGATVPQNLPPPQNNAPGILAEYYILFFIALGLIFCRCYVRLGLARSSGWKWDDTLIIVAWVFLLIGLILIELEVNLGLGQHIYYLDDPETQALGILKYNTFFQMDNVICTLFTKYSISLYILRINDTKWLRWTLAISMVFMTLATIAVIVVLSVSCMPLEKLWDPTIPGTCLPLNTVYTVAYVQSGFTIAVDLALTLSPILLLWNIRIELKRKIAICGLMSLGIVATIANALRNDYQSSLTSKDFTYDTTSVTVVAILELSFGIIAACIPACMPLFRLKKLRSQQASSYRYNTGSSTTGRGNASRAMGSKMESRLDTISSRDEETGDGDVHSLSNLHPKEIKETTTVV